MTRPRRLSVPFLVGALAVLATLGGLPIGHCFSASPGPIDASTVTTARAPAAEPALAPSTASLGLHAPSWPDGTIRTLFPYYNSYLAGNFDGSVAQWQVGAPAFLPNSSTVWWPQLPVPSGALPLPPTGPTLVYDDAAASVVGFTSTVTNASALAVDPSRAVLWVAWALNNTVEGFSLTDYSRASSPLPTGTYPVALALDPVTERLFVANRGSNTVTVIDASRGVLVDQGVPVGRAPSALALDASDGLVYVANAESSNLSVIRTSAPTAAPTSFNLFNGPAVALAYSASAGTIAAVEPASKYVTMVDASTESVIPFAVVVGTGAAAVATDLNGSEFVVANSSGASLRTVGAVSPFPVGSNAIPTGPRPTVLATDPVRGTVLVWSSGNRTISEVNLSTGNVTSVSPSLGPAPSALAWDSARGSVFVADPAVSALEEIDPVTGVLDAPPIELSAPPTSVVLSPSGDTAYVALGRSVAAFDASSHALLAQANLSGTAGPLLLDPGTGILWAGDAGSSTVVGLAAANLSQVASTGPLTVDPSAPGALAFDPATDAVFAINTSDANSVASFDGSNGTTLGPNVFTGPNVTALAFDPADHLLYAAGDTLAAIDPRSDTTVVAGVPLPSPASVTSLLYDPVHTSLLVRSVDLLDGGWVTVVDGASAAGANGTQLRLSVGLGDGSLSFAPPQGVLGGGGTLLVSNGLSGTLSVLGAPPSVPSFSVAPDPIDLGMPARGALSVVDGAGALATTVAFPTGCSLAPNLTVLCVPEAAGTYNLSVTLTDAYGEAAVARTSLVVHDALTATAGVVEPASPPFEAGTVLTFLAAGEGGTAPYSYAWTFGDGGTATGAMANHSYAVSTSFSPWVLVTDALGASTVVGLSVGITAAPTVEILTPSTPFETDVGLSVNLSAVAAGGYGFGSAHWTFGDGTGASGLLVSHTWAHRGVYSVRIDYTDAVGVTADATVALTVHPALNATFQVTPVGGSNVAGSDEQFVATPDGGAGNYTVLWSFGDGSFGTGTSCLHAYGRAGNYTVDATVRDSAGGSASDRFSVSIGSPSVAAAAAPAAQAGPVLALGLVLGGTVAAVLLYAAERSKHRRRVKPPTAYEPPSPPTG